MLFIVKFKSRIREGVSINYYFFAYFFPLCVEKQNSPFSRDSLLFLGMLLMNLSEIPVTSLANAIILMFNLSSFFLKNCTT